MNRSKSSIQVIIAAALVTLCGSAGVSATPQENPCREEIDRLKWQAMDICENNVKDFHVVCTADGRVTRWSAECGGVD